MALFKVETAVDGASGLISASLFYPADAAEPLASTSPIYSSHEEAEAEVIAIMQKALPEQPLRPV